MLSALGILTTVAIGITAVGAVGVLAFTGIRPTFWHWRPDVPQKVDALPLEPMDEYIPYI